MAGLRVSFHALDRWRERVRPGATDAVAVEDILTMAGEGKIREKPPRWARQGGIRGGPGMTFIVWHRRPGIALVVRDRATVVTVMTRQGGQRFREEQRRRRKWDRPPKRANRRPLGS